jgi:hypothetical protein
MGALQLALLDECLKETYRRKGVFQRDPSTWRAESMPDFGDLRQVLEDRVRAGPKDLRARGLRTKLSLAFDFQIFGKPQVPLPGKPANHEEREGHEGEAVRVDLSKLPPSLQYLAADTLLNQIFRLRQLEGLQAVWLYLIIDESKLCTPVKKDSPLAALNRIATEGRKFGLGLILSSQFTGHVGRDVLVNTFTKILMKTDKTEIAATARRFRVEETLLHSLGQPGDALVNFADSAEWKEAHIGRS